MIKAEPCPPSGPIAVTRVVIIVQLIVLHQYIIAITLNTHLAVVVNMIPENLHLMTGPDASPVIETDFVFLNHPITTIRRWILFAVDRPISRLLRILFDNQALYGDMSGGPIKRMSCDAHLCFVACGIVAEVGVPVAGIQVPPAQTGIA